MKKKIKITIQHQNSDKNCMMIDSVVDFFNHRHYYTYDSINIATDKDKLHLRRMGLLDDSLLSADKIKTGNFVIVEPIHNVIRVLDKYNDSFAAYTWDSRKDIAK